MYKAKPFLDKDFPLSLYFSYIHSYINHTNLAWASTHKTNLKKIHSQQKHALQIVDTKYKYTTRKNFSDPCNALNVYKLNLRNTFIFRHEIIKTGTGPAAFHAAFKMLSRSYPTRFPGVDYSKPKTRLRKSRFQISIRGTFVWNNFAAIKETELESSSLFELRVKTKLIGNENE